MLRRVVADDRMTIASAAIADTALRCHHFYAGNSGTVVRRSGCLAVTVNATISCGASNTAIAQLCLLLFMTPPCLCGGRCAGIVCISFLIISIPGTYS